MPEFPEYIVGGPTVVLNTQPIQYRPMNLQGMIQSVRERPDKKKKTPGIPSSKDFEIEGRIGAVNQYMRPIREKIGQLQNLVKLYGSAAYDMPEYSTIMTDLSDLSNSQRQNIVSEETKMRDNYKANTEGKGAYFDLFNWAKTGEAKTVAQWNEINQYAETVDLGDPQTNEQFRKGFDENPTLYGMEEARAAVDELFKQVGVFESGGAREVLYDDFIGDMYGVIKEYNSSMSKRNFTGDFEKGDQLDAAHRQAWRRALDGVDVTDPIMAGYLQGFLQDRGGFDSYYNDKMQMDEESQKKFMDDFTTFVENDLSDHYAKRKIDIFKSDHRKSFEEGSDYHYEKAEEAQMVEEMMQAMKQQTVSSEGRENFGLPMDNVFNTGFLNETAERDYVLAGDKSPFVVQQDGDGNNYITVNDKYDEDALRAKAIEYYNKKYPDGSPAPGVMKGSASYRSAEDYADAVVANTNAERDRVEYETSRGMGMSGTTRQVYDESYVPTGGVPKSFLDGVNSEYLLGQTAEDMGVGNVIQVGETFMNLTDFGNAVYEGAGGALKLAPNTIASNSGVKTPDGKIILFTSPQWQNATDEMKEQMSRGGTIGTWDADGYMADAAAFQGKPVPMDEATMDVLAKMANEGTINSAYYSPGTLRMASTFSFANEKEAAKALQGKTFKKEVPLRYAGTNSAYDRAYDEIVSVDATIPLAKQLIRNAKYYKGEERDRFVTEGAKQLLQEIGVDPNSDDGKEFVEVINKNKDNLRNMGKSHIVDMAVNAKLGELNEAWNFKTAVTYKDQPIAKGNRLDRDFKSMSKWRKGTSKDGTKRNMLTLDMNVTEVAMNGITDPKQRRVMRGFTQRATNDYFTNQRYKLNKNRGKTGKVQTQTYGGLGFGGANDPQSGIGRKRTQRSSFAQDDIKVHQNR